MELNLSTILEIEHQFRSAKNQKELGYLIVNQSRALLPYDRAVLLTKDNKRYRVDAISDISAVDKNSTYTHWVESVSTTLSKVAKDSVYIANLKRDLSDIELRQLKDYQSVHIAYINLSIKKDDTTIESALMIFRDSAYSKDEELILKHIAHSYSYYIYASRKCTLSSKIKDINKNNKALKYILVAIFLAMFIPINMSVLAPAQIEPKEPHIVTSPISGVIEKVTVKPNQSIKQKQLLLKLDTTDNQNRYFVAKESLSVAKAALYAAKQNSFYDRDAKKKIATLDTEVKLKQSELKYAKDILQKSFVYANIDGIAIINNPSQWIGKPVSTGEKIFVIADKSRVEVSIMLPVSDAIFLEKGAKVKIFLDNEPLKSYNATLTHISYQPQLTEQNIVAYKITANLDYKSNLPTIGLRGTAKIYSQDVTLFFYLFRKPITALRTFVGW
jgi:hypothetical protein